MTVVQRAHEAASAGLTMGPLSGSQLLLTAAGVIVAVLLFALVETLHRDNRERDERGQPLVSGLLRARPSEPTVYRAGRSTQWVRSKAAADPSFQREDDTDAQ